MFFDLHNDGELATEFRRDMLTVLGRYEITPEVRKAVIEDDVATLAPLVNPYLLRFYFQVRGMPQNDFIARLSSLDATKGSVNG